MQAELKIGDIVEAEVTKITNFGAFVKILGQTTGLIHISQVADTFVKDINEHLKIGDKLQARIIKIGPANKIDLSLKKSFAPRSQRDNPGPPASRKYGQAGFKSSDFEEKLKKFLKQSQHNLAELKKHNEKYYR